MLSFLSTLKSNTHSYHPTNIIQAKQHLWGYFFKGSDSLSVKVKSNKLSLAFFFLGWWVNGRHQHSKCLFPLTTILSLSPNFSDPISSIPVSCSNGPTHVHLLDVKLECQADLFDVMDLSLA